MNEQGVTEISQSCNRCPGVGVTALIFNCTTATQGGLSPKPLLDASQSTPTTSVVLGLIFTTQSMSVCVTGVASGRKFTPHTSLGVKTEKFGGLNLEG